MSKKAAIISVIIILGTMGGVMFLLSGSGNISDMPGQQAATQTSTETEAKTDMDTTSQSTASAGKYVDYDENSIKNTSGTKLLFFHAPWCPQCRALESDIKAQGVPAGVTVIKVDYDSNQALRQKYGVTLQTTFVKVDDSGNLVKKYTAYQSPTLASVKANLL